MKYAFIQTFGCQMNEYDSNRMKEILAKEGYTITEEMKEADLVLVNTCSVRENPENKVYSLVGRLALMKRKNPELIIGVGGCVAQQEGEAILKRAAAVDMVFGTDCLIRLPEMLQEIRAGRRVLHTEWMPREKKVQNFIPEEELEAGRVIGCKGMVAITKGCDNYCTYCIVPTTRGRLVSREAENILQEALDLIRKGAVELQLLGQNVNSYQAGHVGFYELLAAVANLPGLKRLRFTSPHPNDWTPELTDLMASNPVICNQVHLPFQAGSDRILSLMKRDHTAEQYLEKIRYMKERIPGICFGTDIIVGFPGETDEEYQETLKILQAVRFSQVYAYKYSPRPGTKAEKLEDNVPQKIKEERLNHLFEIQAKIQQEELLAMVGKRYEVLIENAHPRERGAMSGRTEGFIPVTIPQCHREIGDFVQVEILEPRTHSLTAVEV